MDRGPAGIDFTLMAPSNAMIVLWESIPEEH